MEKSSSNIGTLVCVLFTEHCPENSRSMLDLIFHVQENSKSKMLDLLLNNIFNIFYKTIYSLKTSHEGKFHKFFSSHNFDFVIWHRQYTVFPGGFEQFYNKLLENPSPSVEEMMRFEICRLASFSQAPNSFRGCPSKLAKGCFYYTQESNNCKCAFCGIVKDDWEYIDNTDTEHRRLNPICPFFTEEPGGALETNYSIANGDNGQQPTLSLQAFMQSPAVARGGYVSGHQQDMSFKGPSLISTYAILTNRKTSFGRWPKSASSPDRLAEAGFFYTGSRDLVTCAFCGKMLRNWQADCDPLIEHAHWSPDCNFVKGKDKLFVQLVQSINLRSSLLPVEESTDGSSIVNDNRQNVKTKTNSTPRYPEFLQSRDRLSTFCGWSTHSRISHYEMVKSGLFYTGVKDYVKCFYCGIGLFHWEEGDDPIFEQYPYLKQITLIEERTISNYIRSSYHQVEAFEEQSNEDNEESLQLPNEQQSSSISESRHSTSNSEDQSQSRN